MVPAEVGCLVAGMIGGDSTDELVKGRKIASAVSLKIKLATRINPDGRDNRMRRCAPLAIVEYVRAYGGPW
jgi:hypothetical protein